LEAMAAGTPIVTSDIEGIEEYIRHGKEGLIFRRGDTSHLKKYISFLIENQKLRKKIGKAAKARVKRIDYLNLSKELLNFLEQLFQNKKPTKSVDLLKYAKNKSFTKFNK
ncbi:MAG: glycosyltransferase, partial [Candidatus Woesearchaeota archaeon]